MNAAEGISNGQVSGAEIADLLQEEATVGYRPVMPLEAMWLSGSDMPQITLRRDIEFMQMHPIVMTGLDYYKSGISGAEFWGGPDHNNPDNGAGKPISPNQRVAMFVLAHAERFWQRGMPMIQEGAYPYGWASGEHIYKDISGMMTWSHLKDFHPNDTFILTLKHQPIGVRVKNIRDREPVDLWFSSGAVPAKACWYPHRPRFNQFYGRSQLIGAWRPWRRLGWRDAVEQVIDAAIYRAGYKGPVVRHPPEDMQTAKHGIPATQADGRGNPRRSAQDVARQIVEWAKAGAGFTLSSAQYPQAQGGGAKWDVEWPDHVMDVRPLIEAAKYLEDQILLGIGVPPELVRAGGTGSGYSGRSVPREAFLTGQQRVADAMLQQFVEHVIRPLVLMNFGDVPFEVSCKSLLLSQADDKQGQQQGQVVQQPQPQQILDPSAQMQPGMQVPMSLGADITDRALAVVRRVLAKRGSVALAGDTGGSGMLGRIGAVISRVWGRALGKTPKPVQPIQQPTAQQPAVPAVPQQPVVLHPPVQQSPLVDAIGPENVQQAQLEKRISIGRSAVAKRALPMQPEVGQELHSKPLSGMSHLHNVEQFEKHAKAAGVEDPWSTNLRQHEQLNHLGITNESAFKILTNKMDDYLKGAHQYSPSPQKSAMILAKRGELASLRADVHAFHNPPEVRTLPEHYGKRNAAQINIDAAMEHINSGGTHHSAVQHLMQTGGLLERSAKHYVRQAAKKADAHRQASLLKFNQENPLPQEKIKAIGQPKIPVTIPITPK